MKLYRKSRLGFVLLNVYGDIPENSIEFDEVTKFYRVSQGHFIEFPYLVNGL